jgi:hypothetical protein
MNFPIYEEGIKLTPSEQKVLGRKLVNPELKILRVERSIGGWLLITEEKLAIRKTEKHEPPFRYRRNMYGRRGARLKTWMGNQIFEDGGILDDFTDYTQSHINGYKR